MSPTSAICRACSISRPTRSRPSYPILAKDEVRHVGDSVAFVVAETIDQARDAIEAIDVKWTCAPGGDRRRQRREEGSAAGLARQGRQRAIRCRDRRQGRDRRRLRGAHAVAEISIVNPRVVANFMETRAAVCEYDAKKDHLTLTVGSSGSYRLRDIICQNVLKIPTDKMRVICPDVGGGFGTKLFPHREYALMAVAAQKLKKAVKWAADRSEHFMGDAYGPRQRHYGEEWRWPRTANSWPWIAI